jgi:hypothetical protein
MITTKNNFVLYLQNTNSEFIAHWQTFGGPLSGLVGTSKLLVGQLTRTHHVRVGPGFHVAHLGDGPNAPPFFTDTNDRAFEMPPRHICGRPSL